MPTNISGRVTLIAVVLLAALWLIFPNPVKLLNPNVPFGEKHNLKPGIDMVGGTSLLYEIKAPPGSVDSDLAIKVMESLKRRVDPQGIRNLIWRPQGNTRLEIQMPLSGTKGESGVKRKAYSTAQETLDNLNVRSGQVTEAVERLTGDARRARLTELARGATQRDELFGAMASTYDQIQQARAAKDSAKQAELEEQYDALKAKVEATNLSSLQLEGILLSGTTQRDAELAALKARFADFPDRLSAMDAFRKAWTDFQDVKGSIDDASDLKRLLKGSGVLEFHILVTDYSSPEYVAMTERLQKNGPRAQAGDTTRWVQVDRPAEFKGRGLVTYNTKNYVLVYTSPGKQLVNGPNIPKWALENAHLTTDQNGRAIVGFRFDPQGGALFSTLTRNNVGTPLGIVLDEKIISAPNINSEIGQDGIIQGDFSRQELNYLISTLNAGSLPAQLADEPISERTVGPQLGADNLRAGLYSCFVGLIVVAIFLAIYYHLSGVVAFFAVVLNLVMILGVMAMLNATFTLPGVAGIVLTIGAAVDSNVLIFERLREEQLRGLSLKMALRNAYDRAFSAILDSNMTTVITSLVLVWLGSEEVKGFGITLLIGLASSLFTSLFVTKTVFAFMIEKMGLTHLGSFPLKHKWWDDFLKPNVDWMGKAWAFTAFSVIFMVLGVIFLVKYWKANQLFDIEFASGTSVQFELKEPMKIDQVRDLVSDRKVASALPSPSVVSVGNDEKTYEIVTPNEKSRDVQNAIQAAFEGKLNIEQASQYDGVGLSEQDARGRGLIVPITSETSTVAGMSLPRISDYRGGAAIVLKDLSPQLSANDIKARLSRARLQVQVGQAAQAPADFRVESEASADKPVSTAVVLVMNPDIPFNQDELKWADEVSAPMWKLIQNAINSPPVLQKVSNFDAQVAGDTQRDALVALGLSVAIIMIYIWLRFGNFVYGSATVLAMLHDTLLVVGAIGVAHALHQYALPVANFLQVEPFRINLTIVAAVLTVMSYSMIDTIVVFDRVRENRGKYGHLDRKVINDSINQTLSRTLLTAGTTIATLAVMYFTGGPGIHGFTFILLFGILIGTYSSIAIAAPFLLIFGKTEQAVGNKPVGQLQGA